VKWCESSIGKGGKKRHVEWFDCPVYLNRTENSAPAQKVVDLVRATRLSLTLLQTFEVVARHCSFTRAAEELCLTQSAVSRQVKQLEDELGVLVFSRLHRAIEMTPEGQKLFASVGRGLREIDSGLYSLRGGIKVPQITVSASVAFAHFWLMPKISRFRAIYPDYDLRVLASDLPATIKPGDVDVAVLFGRGQWNGIETQQLFGECVYPVCSPAYLQQHPGLLTPQDLRNHTLLHLDYGAAKWGSIDWPAFFDAHGINGQPLSSGIRLNSYPMVLQAAEAGQGVALGWSYITDPMLAAGQLVKFAGLEMRTKDGYYLGTFEGAANRPEVAAFLNWFKQEAETATALRMSHWNAKHSGS
jgi:LysR family transcriptional regulator, glycine cleavage system transcriptional activator